MFYGIHFLFMYLVVLYKGFDLSQAIELYSNYIAPILVVYSY